MAAAMQRSSWLHPALPAVPGCFMAAGISLPIVPGPHGNPKGFQPPALLLSSVCSSGAVWSTGDEANHAVLADRGLQAPPVPRGDVYSLSACSGPCLYPSPPEMCQAAFFSRLTLNLGASLAGGWAGGCWSPSEHRDPSWGRLGMGMAAQSCR